MALPLEAQRSQRARPLGAANGRWRHAEVAAAKYGLKAVDILVELGKRRMVGGQEDMIVDVALDILQQRASAAA